MSRDTFDKSRTIVLQGDVDDSMAETALRHLSELNALSAKPIIVTVNSWGGSVTDGMAISDAMAASPAPVTILGIGACYSAAAVMVALGPPGRRYCAEHCAFMFHQTKGGAANDSMEAMQGYAEFQKRLDEEMYKAICCATGFSARSFLRDMRHGKEIWLTAAEAEKRRIVDGIWTAEVYAEVLGEIRKGRK